MTKLEIFQHLFIIIALVFFVLHVLYEFIWMGIVMALSASASFVFGLIQEGRDNK